MNSKMPERNIAHSALKILDKFIEFIRGSGSRKRSEPQELMTVSRLSEVE